MVQHPKPGKSFPPVRGIVLKASLEPPFELLAEASLFPLSLKTSFIIAQCPTSREDSRHYLLRAL